MSRVRSAIGRRHFLGRAALGAGGLSLSGLAASCGAWSTAGDPGVGRLHVENWPAYIDATSNGRPGTVDRFRAATGIDINYTEAINDNDEYFAKIQPRLGTGRVIEPDVMVLSSWMAERLIRLGWVDPLPLAEVRNRVNIEDAFAHPKSDPAGAYCLPWQGVMVGIGYNRQATGRDLGSIDDLFAADLKGRVGMLTEMRDTIGMILLSLGIDPSAVTSFAQAAPAFERLERAKATGQVRAFTGNDFLDDLSTGNFAACVAWLGDVLQLSRDNPHVRFIIPEQGGLLATDTMLMPKGAGHREEAAAWMNFVYDPAEAARITEGVQTISPVKGVRDELARFDAPLAANPLLFPDAAVTARLKIFANLAEDVEQQFDEAFSRIIGA